MPSRPSSPSPLHPPAPGHHPVRRHSELTPPGLPASPTLRSPASSHRVLYTRPRSHLCPAHHPPSAPIPPAPCLALVLTLLQTVWNGGCMERKAASNSHRAPAGAGAVLNTLLTFSHLVLSNITGRSSFLPVLQVRTLRHRQAQTTC